ncbi:MAG: tRNA (guanosine(46)-N7)-methyltransferase TrmB [Bacilli bacterium]|nr:tRNA (guanosine(46)-N7)-methyltransferase TrmB [Bacilli bacterium]
MRLKHNDWAIPFLESHQQFVLTVDTIKNEEAQKFINSQPIYIEIGTGKGDFILEMARKNPDINFLGVEMNAMALGSCAKKIDEAQLSNVKLINIDISKLVEYLPKYHFTGIFLNFSDPWPKKRHTKRRLTYPTLLKEYAKLLIKDGRIYQKTDNVGLFDYSLNSYEECEWEQEFGTYDYDGNDDFDAMSEYERKFRSIGHPICKAILKKGIKTHEA